MTNRYRISSSHSSVELGVYEGANEAEALDAMARDAGYADHAAACEVAPVEDDELLIEKIEYSLTVSDVREIAAQSGLDHAEFCLEQSEGQLGREALAEARAEFDRLDRERFDSSEGEPR